MHLIYLNSKTFLAREIVNALTKCRDISVTTASIAEKTASDSAPEVFEQLQPRLPAIVLSINNAGYDHGGRLQELLLDAGCFLVNWYTDDPFYERTFYGARMTPSARRLDFVSEESFVEPLRAEGFSAHFLPLAVDPAFFNVAGDVPLERDVAFVGNSTLEFLDGIITEEVQREVERSSSLVNEAKRRYFSDPRTDVRQFIMSRIDQWQSHTTLTPAKFAFVIEWLIGYWHRRDSIVGIAQHYGSRFTCFGDGYWGRFINPSQVSADACYYTNLCQYYRSTRVNLNINRIQIRTSFTQRIFDCKASGAFLLTDKRALNSRFFVTQGPNRELVEFSSPQECRELIDYYLAHDDERRAVAMAGRDKVLGGHTYDVRIEEVLDTCHRAWGV